MAKQSERLALAVMLAADYRPKAEYVLRYGSNVTRDAARDSAAICRHATTIRRWAELECNGIQRWNPDYYGPGKGGMGAAWDDNDQARADKATERAQKAIVRVLENYRVESQTDDYGKRYKVKFQGDPRGWLVSFRLKSARESWGY